MLMCDVMLCFHDSISEGKDVSQDLAVPWVKVMKYICFIHYFQINIYFSEYLYL